MKIFRIFQLLGAWGLGLSILVGGACGFPEPPQDAGTIPENYASSHMPQGWWANTEIIEAGRQIYLGNEKSSVNCSRCHGKLGKPLKAGARDLRDSRTMKIFSDSYLLWRISEGIPFSKMQAYKNQLSREEIWKVITYVSTLGMSGQQYDPIKKKWVPITGG